MGCEERVAEREAWIHRRCDRRVLTVLALEGKGIGAKESAATKQRTGSHSATSALASGLPMPVRRRTLRGMLDWTQCSAVERVPGKVSGAWVFKETRVPVQALFENLEGGATVDQFLEWFPGVSREQALAVLKFAETSLAVSAA
jgi:uncharacterized protein (DUF433 family)